MYNNVRKMYIIYNMYMRILSFLYHIYVHISDDRSHTALNAAATTTTTNAAVVAAMVAQ